MVAFINAVFPKESFAFTFTFLSVTKKQLSFYKKKIDLRHPNYNKLPIRKICHVSKQNYQLQIDPEMYSIVKGQKDQNIILNI